MLERITTIALLLFGFTLPSFAQDAPPGLILVKGGKTKIGSDLKAIESYVLQNKLVANTLAGETPMHTVQVEDFYLMPTEVTNDQYQEFVTATGAKPPSYWAEEAIEKAKREHVLSEGEKFKEARDAGREYKSKTFDTVRWWDKNWETVEVNIPTDQLEQPVNFVTYYDAEAYCEWAGLRLMTEQEFQRAARGNSDRVFPWGDKFEVNACNSLHHEEKDGPMVVGSFPDGAVNGIFDLVGNVFEWTQSVYDRFPGYKPIKVKDRRNVIEGLANFSSDKRVLVGGSFTTSEDGCRISVRNPATRRQAAEAVGFRCASDLQLGTAPATWSMRRDIRISNLPGDGDFDFSPESTAILYRYSSRQGGTGVEGYAVITDVQRTLFCPVEKLTAGSASELSKQTLDQPAFLGFFKCEFPIMEPALNGGTYYIAWRGAGKLRGDAATAMAAAEKDGLDPLEETLAADFWKAEGFDAGVDCFFFYGLDGIPVLAIPAPAADFSKLRGPTTMKWEAFVPPTEEEIDEDAPPVIPMDNLRIQLRIPGKRSSKGFQADFVLGIEPGLIDASWK